MASPTIPAPGLGTYRNDDHDQCAESVRTALEVGYRHVDTAEAYGNETAVGEGIASAEVDSEGRSPSGKEGQSPSSNRAKPGDSRTRSGDRDEVFLATKVLHPKFTDDYSAESIESNVRGCLDRLDVDSVDLFYGVHWPGGGYDPETTFDVMADLHDEGLFDRLGVCNLTPEGIDEAQAASSVPITAVQVELHPLLPQSELRAYCDRNDMDLVAYAPLGNGAVLGVPEVQAVADDHGVSPARVSVAWCLEKGVVPIPKGTGREHIVDNWRACDLELTEEDVARIDGIDRTERQYDPEYAPDW